MSGLLPDFPSAEPVGDLNAQLADMGNPRTRRTGVFLSHANLSNLASQGTGLVRAQVAAATREGRAVQTPAGLLLLASPGAAAAARERLANGENPQVVVGAATGAGTGKTADQTLVVQGHTPTGAVAVEGSVTPAQVKSRSADVAAQGYHPVITTPDAAVARREANITTPAWAPPASDFEHKPAWAPPSGDFKEPPKKPGLLDSTLYNNPLVGTAELGLQAASAIPTFLGKALTGVAGIATRGRAGMSQTAKDINDSSNFTYEPQTDFGKLGSKAIAAVGQGLHNFALERAKGPLAEYDPLTMAKTGIRSAVHETPEQSAYAGAGTEILANAIPAVTGGQALVRTMAALPTRVARYFDPALQSRNVIRNVAGTEAQRAAQAAALRNSGSLNVHPATPNAGPTAAQALTQTPEGTTIQALQQAIAALPGKGISPDFALRFAQQQAAQEAALADLNSATGPMRDSAFAAVRARGGVNLPNVVGDIAGVRSQAGVAGSPAAQSILTATRKFMGNGSRIDPETLYTFRKTGLGNIIEDTINNPKTASSFAKGSTAKGIQQAIDQGITDSGAGPLWQQYLDAYSAGRKPIEALKTATEDMYSPQQRTNVGGEAGLPTGIGAPHLLSAKASILNYGLGLRRALMGKSINRNIANQLLDPNALADTLTSTDAAPAIRAAPALNLTLIDALRNRQDNQ